MNRDLEFTKNFNEWYPFERYIIFNPQPISSSFDDMLLTEIFIKDTEIKPILNRDGSLSSWTKINDNDVSIKVSINGVEARLAYYDFDYGVRGSIQEIFHEDFGQYEWQSLYVEYEDKIQYEDVIDLLFKQKQLIESKYGECKVKDTYKDQLIINLLNVKEKISKLSNDNISKIQ